MSEDSNVVGYDDMSLHRRFDTACCPHLQGSRKLARGCLFFRIHQQCSSSNSRPLRIILFYPAVGNVLNVPFRHFTVIMQFTQKAIPPHNQLMSFFTDLQYKQTGQNRSTADQCLLYAHPQFLCKTLFFSGIIKIITDTQSCNFVLKFVFLPLNTKFLLCDFEVCPGTGLPSTASRQSQEVRHYNGICCYVVCEQCKSQSSRHNI